MVLGRGEFFGEEEDTESGKGIHSVSARAISHNVRAYSLTVKEKQLESLMGTFPELKKVVLRRFQIKREWLRARFDLTSELHHVQKGNIGRILAKNKGFSEEIQSKIKKRIESHFGQKQESKEPKNKEPSQSDSRKKVRKAQGQGKVSEGLKLKRCQSYSKVPKSTVDSKETMKNGRIGLPSFLFDVQEIGKVTNALQSVSSIRKRSSNLFIEGGIQPEPIALMATSRNISQTPDHRAILSDKLTFGEGIHHTIGFNNRSHRISEFMEKVRVQNQTWNPQPFSTTSSVWEETNASLLKGSPRLPNKQKKTPQSSFPCDEMLRKSFQKDKDKFKGTIFSRKLSFDQRKWFNVTGTCESKRQRAETGISLAKKPFQFFPDQRGQSTRKHCEKIEKYTKSNSARVSMVEISPKKERKSIVDFESGNLNWKISYPKFEETNKKQSELFLTAEVPKENNSNFVFRSFFPQETTKERAFNRHSSTPSARIFQADKPTPTKLTKSRHNQFRKVPSAKHLAVFYKEPTNWELFLKKY